MFVTRQIFRALWVQREIAYTVGIHSAGSIMILCVCQSTISEFLCSLWSCLLTRTATDLKFRQMETIALIYINNNNSWDLRFSRRRVWRWLSSGLLRHVDWYNMFKEFWRWSVAINSTITLDFVHVLGYLLKTHNVSETGSVGHQVKVGERGAYFSWSLRQS
jgi:hypothetical protein